MAKLAPNYLFIIILCLVATNYGCKSDNPLIIEQVLYTWISMQSLVKVLREDWTHMLSFHLNYTNLGCLNIYKISVMSFAYNNLVSLDTFIYFLYICISLIMPNAHPLIFLRVFLQNRFIELSLSLCRWTEVCVQLLQPSWGVVGENWTDYVLFMMVSMGMKYIPFAEVLNLIKLRELFWNKCKFKYMFCKH